MSTGPEPAGPGAVLLEEDGDGPVVRFTGPVDREAVRRFRLAAPPSTWPGRVDLSPATSLDAAALELLVHLTRKPRRRGGELVLLGVPRSLHPVLVRAGLSSLLPRPGSTSTSA